MKETSLIDIYQKKFLISDEYMLLKNNLDVISPQPNIFKILNTQRDEVKHSKFLSWLLNPNENKEVGTKFLFQVLNFIQENKNTSYKNYSLDSSFIKVFPNFEEGEHKNIDILIETSEFVVCIENKVDSSEHSSQLSRYKRYIDKNFKNLDKYFIYLSPSGKKPLEEIESYIPMSYQNIIEFIENIKDEIKERNTKLYLSDYLYILKNETLKNLENLLPASKLYLQFEQMIKQVLDGRNQKDSFEYKIFQNDIRIFRLFEHSKINYLWIKHQIETELVNNNFLLGSESDTPYIRFYPKEFKKYIYISKSNNGWNQYRETFLFEIKISKNKLTFWSCVNKGGDKFYDYQNLINIISKIPNSNSSKNIHYVKSSLFEQKLKFNEIANYTSSQVSKTISEVIQKYVPVINMYKDEFERNKTFLKI